MCNYDFFDSTVENELLQNGAYISVTKGSSMRPLFKTNRDVVRLERYEREPKKYDVVLYRNKNGNYILHRIVKVLPDWFIIRGDNTFISERVPKDSIIAVLTGYNRKGKKHSTEDIGYRIYSRLWNFVYPARYLFHKTFRFVYGAYKKIFK